jgi:uncharacterized protein (TIGR03086 family)
VETLELAEQAFGFARSRIAGIGDTALDSPTPCDEWDLRRLVNHAVNAVGIAAGVLNGTDDRDPWAGSAEALAAADIGWPDAVGSYDEVVGSVFAAARAGALERLYFLHQAQMPGEVMIRSVAFDSAVHGWDIARATGQDPTIPEAVALEFLPLAASIAEPTRSIVFRPVVDVAATASASDRLVALLGRNPN